MGHLLSRFGVLLLKDGLEPRLLLLVGMSGQAQVFVDVLVTCRLLIANQFSRLVDFDLQNERKNKTGNERDPKVTRRANLHESVPWPIEFCDIRVFQVVRICVLQDAIHPDRQLKGGLHPPRPGRTDPADEIK